MAGSQKAVELLSQAQNLGFVEFTTQLLLGVANTLINSRIQQLEAYAKLVEQVSQPLAAYQKEVSGIDFAPSLGPTNNDVKPKLENYIAEVLQFDTSDAVNGQYPIDQAEYKLLENHFGDSLATSDVSKLQPPVGPALGGIAITYLNELIYHKIKGDTAKQYDLLVQIVQMGPKPLEIIRGFVETGMQLNVAGLDEAASSSYLTANRESGWHAGGQVKGMLRKIGFGVNGGYTAKRFQVNVGESRNIQRTTLDGTMSGRVKIEFTTLFAPTAAATAPDAA